MPMSPVTVPVKMVRGGGSIDVVQVKFAQIFLPEFFSKFERPVRYEISN